MRICKIPAVVGIHSLVGVGNARWPDKPLEFGNYFSFQADESILGFGPKCVNMWAENLEAIAEGLGLKEIEVAIFDARRSAKTYSFIGTEPDFAYVIDPVVPRNWLIPNTRYLNEGRPGICITGCGFISPETLQEIIDFHLERNP